MRLLLDECVPRRLRGALARHEVKTAPEMGWAGKKNGELLGLAEKQFDVLVTTDQRLRYQQTVARFSIAVVVLVAKRNKLEHLVPLLPELERVLAEIKPGEVHRVPSLRE